MTEWISVYDKVPQEGQDVIYFARSLGVFIGKYEKNDYGDCFYGEYGWLTDEVTHWIPLPEFPKEDSDGTARI